MKTKWSASLKRVVLGLVALAVLAAALPGWQPALAAAKAELKKDDKGAAVRQLQEDLQEKGFYTYKKITGTYGEGTVKAVKAYQKKNKLEVTGVADAKTLKKLWGSKYKTKYNSLIKQDEKAASKVLKQGSKGTEVKELQKRLKELGYFTATVNGNYGSQTKAAVKAFQKANGLTANGVASEATQKKLKSSKAVAKKSSAADTSKEAKSLKYGDTGDAVKAMQKRLKELGYFGGTPQGNYLSATRSAVRAFQKANGLKETGNANEDTLKRIHSKDAVAKGEEKKEDEEVKALKQGSKGTAVKELQKRLKELGYFTATANGNYGSQTKEAVKDFQKANGLTANGVANEATQKKIASKDAVAKGEASDDLSKTLKQGSKGTAVKELQKRLKELGYFTGTPQGNYGRLTKEAVKEFQKANGLKADGVAGEATRKKIASKDAVAKGEEQDDLSKTLKYGDKGGAVKALQEQLKKLGYFTGTPQGNFGPTTQSAVKAFQKANSLSQTGKANEATRKLLASGKAVSKEEYEKDKALETLKPGQKNDQVKAMQKRLKELGYFEGECNGSYGTVTTKAVKEFQEANGLTVSGIAYSATRKALASDKAVTKAQAEEAQKPKELKYGSKGEAVKELQTRLKQLGYFEGSPQGNYGTLTKTAVKDFQTANGLKADGVAGEATQKKLDSKNAVTKAEYEKAKEEEEKKKEEDEKEQQQQSAAAKRKERADKVINAAYAQLGKKYVWGTGGPSTFDCSGLTCYAFKQVGISLSRTAYSQGYGAGTKVSRSQLQRGDIVCFNTLSDSDLSDHVGIYMGNNKFIHASSGGGRVMVSELTGYYERNFSWGRSVL